MAGCSQPDLGNDQKHLTCVTQILTLSVMICHMRSCDFGSLCKISDSIISKSLSDRQYNYHRLDRNDPKVFYILSLRKQLIYVQLRDPSTDGPTASGVECRRVLEPTS